MLPIVLIAVAVVWAAVVAVALGLCVSAARGDRELLDERPAPGPARTGGRSVLALVTRTG